MLERSVTNDPAIGLTDLKIAPHGWDENRLAPKTGAQVSAELGGRYLLRYLLASQLGTLTAGSSHRTYVTPTSLTPEETVPVLALPAPGYPRTHVLLIDPANVGAAYRILGPRWVKRGNGIEYLLPDGFPEASVVNIAGTPGTNWELQVT